MESLALTHSFVAYEEPASQLQFRSIEDLGLKIPNSAWIGLAGVAVALSVVAIPTEAQAAYVRTNGGRLNVRSGPGLHYCVLGKLHNGDHVKTTGYHKRGWVKLKNGGWVAAHWLGQGSKKKHHISYGRKKKHHVSHGRKKAHHASHHSCYHQCVY